MKRYLARFGRLDHAAFEQYSFIWSQLRLVLAAGALFVGGIPLLYAVTIKSPGLYAFVGFILFTCWIISGAASVYLVYRWTKHDRTMFGERLTLDTVALFLSAISGLNLGLAAIIRLNIGMSIWSGHFIFIVTGLIYLATAFYLHGRWNKYGKKVWK